MLITNLVTHAEAGGPLSDTAASQAIDKCARQLASRFDAENGGFGSAPKFPRPAEINVLLCSHTRSTAGGATVESRAPKPSTCLNSGLHIHLLLAQHCRPCVMQNARRLPLNAVVRGTKYARIP